MQQSLPQAVKVRATLRLRVQHGCWSIGPAPWPTFATTPAAVPAPLVRVPRTTPSRERRRAPIADARPACLAASGEAVALDDRTGPRAVGAGAGARDRRPAQRHDSRGYARRARA